MSSMAKQKQTDQGSGFWSELFRLGLYKPNQGKVVRQLTFLAIAVIGCLAAYELYQTGWFDDLFSGARYVTLVTFGAVSVWFGYRIVNYSKFADFLIAVEAEMNKVSWPTKQELWRSAVVVIFVIFAMAFLLYFFDIVWSFIFSLLRIRA